jgi:hypothetical protein
VLRLENIDSAQETAKCRACRYVGPYVGGQRIPRLTDNELAHPPKGIHVQRGFGNEITLVCRPHKKSVRYFVSALGGLAVYGLVLITSLRTSPGWNWTHASFWLGALIGMVGVAGGLPYFLVGKTVVAIAPGRARISTKVLGIGRVQDLVLDGDTRVALETSTYRERNIPQLEIVVQSKGTTTAFGAKHLSLEAKKYVAAVLRRATGGR